MDSQKKIARMAGLVYLIVIVTGIFTLGYVPSKLLVEGNDALTLQNIITSETLFRFGILGSISCYIAFLILPLILYKLLRPVNKSFAIGMAVLAIVSVPLSLINLSNKFAILTLINKAGYLGTTELQHLQTEVLLYLDYYNNGIQLVSIFWGLWLFPFGYLVFKSGFLPKVLGILLMAGCFGYLLNFTGRLLCPKYSDFEISKFVALPATIGEIGICLWLLIIGVRYKRLP